MADTLVLLLDVRSEEEYAQGHIAGAINIPHSEILQSHQLPEDKSQVISVYCQMGGRAQTASQFLEAMGYDNVTNLGGISDLLEAGFELEK